MILNPCKVDLLYNACSTYAWEHYLHSSFRFDPHHQLGANLTR